MSLTNFTIDPKTRCWVWQGWRNKAGYGQLPDRSLAHRASYESRWGPIPEGAQIDHRCRNKACINPVHLRPVTRSFNAVLAGRAQRRQMHPRQLRVARWLHDAL